MRIPATLIAAFVLVATTTGATRSSEPRTTDAHGVVVHEWGTFTTVAGADGQAVPWLPLGGPTDLPCFVHYFDNRLIKLAPGTRYTQLLDYRTARTSLKGTVRMETPVLYFYAAQPTSVDVAVTFPQGLFTEWYPRAAVMQVPHQDALMSKTARQAMLFWPRVQVRPGTQPELEVERDPSHYYAARRTDGAPVRVDREDEKFLFYRGVAGFASPIAAEYRDNGQVIVTNRSGAEIPRAILFTKQGSRLAYRVTGPLSRDARITIDPAPTAGTFAALRQELERTLVAHGLYAKEATAMVDTWRDSWFEEGTRVFYIVPASTVDRVLPLQITPRPTSTVRVFVGRMDVIPASAISTVETAFAGGDRAPLTRYGRLLGPIADRILARTTAPEPKARMLSQLDEVLRSYASRFDRCAATPPATTDALQGILPQPSVVQVRTANERTVH